MHARLCYTKLIKRWYVVLFLVAMALGSLVFFKYQDNEKQVLSEVDESARANRSEDE